MCLQVQAAQPMAMQWNQNLSISEAPPLRPGQAVSYSVAVWLTGCSPGQAAQDAVLTLSLMAHSGLATQMPECAAAFVGTSRRHWALLLSISFDVTCSSATCALRARQGEHAAHQEGVH